MACTSSRADALGHEGMTALPIEQPPADVATRGCETPTTVSDDAMVEDTAPASVPVNSTSALKSADPAPNDNVAREPQNISSNSTPEVRHISHYT